MIVQIMMIFVLWYVVVRIAIMQFREYRNEYEARRNRKLKFKKTEIMANAWADMARKYDPEIEPEKRGLAVARALNLRHALQKMKEEE